MRDSLDSFSTEKLFITGYSDSSDTPVDSDKGIRIIFSVWYDFFKHKCKKYFTLTIGQVCGLPLPIPELIKVVIGHEFNAFLTPLYGKDRNFIFIKPYGMRLGVQTYGA
jgi:hypothetical protein